VDEFGDAARRIGRCGFSIEACGLPAGTGLAARFGGVGTLAGGGAAVSWAGCGLASSEPNRRFSPSQLEPEPELASTALGEGTVDTGPDAIDAVCVGA
jgi:hypothetical protein